MNPAENEAWLRFFKQEMPRMQRLGESFKADFAELWQGQDEMAIGRLLRCHLLVEYYLTEYLEAANPGIGEISSARLTFIQKLSLARGTSILAFFVPGIESINRIRNKTAHRLSTLFAQTDLMPMDEIVNLLRSKTGDTPLTGLELIEEFTRLACSSMHHFAGVIREVAPEDGALGYIRWQRQQLEEMGHPPESNGR